MPIKLEDPLKLTVLSKLPSKIKGTDIEPGRYPFDFTVRFSGTAERGADTVRTPTSRGLTLETMALFIRLCGFQRDHAIDLLVQAMRDNIERDEDQKAALLEISGVAEAKARIDAEMASLPKTPVRGAFRFVDINVEQVGVEVLGDAGQDVQDPTAGDPEIPVISVD